MKILFLSNLYPPNTLGGYERLCFEVAAALAARGHDIYVLTSDHGDAREAYAGQCVRRRWRLPTETGNLYAPFAGTAAERSAIERENVGHLDAAVADWQPDAIFVWNLYFLDVSVLDAIRRLRRPTVYLLTDNWLIAFMQPMFLQDFFAREVFAPVGTPAGWLKRRLKRWRLKFAAPPLHLPGQAIFASRFMAGLYGDAGFSFDRSRIVYHGIAACKPLPSLPDRALRVAAGCLRLLFAGRVVEIKGVHTAIAALQAIRAALPEQSVALTVLGDRQDRTYLERLSAAIADADLGSAVSFAEPVAEAELPAIFAAHDIYLFPSLYEPFSLTLIHALRAGIPTVASDAGGNPEIVAHGRSGMIFARGDAAGLADQVVRLARDDSLRARIAAEGQRVANEYTFDRMVAEVETCLGEAQ